MPLEITMSKHHAGLQATLAAPSFAPPPGSALRRLSASGLRHASRLLARLARQLAQRGHQRQAMRPQVLEFYAEAGAPEGALYLDGQLVGRLPGVTRL